MTDIANGKNEISLCMIVRNEEKTLPGCLNSVKGCVDEIIVVDTGSEDRTVAVAEAYGAKVFRHPWENDFSKHRNQSIQYARGKWIFWLDADEMLEPGGGELLRKACGAHDVDSLLVTMVCYFDNRTRESWNNAVKLFRNRVGIHFEGRVHNQVVGCSNTRFCPAKIHHYGYDHDQLTVRRKFERTSALLIRAIEENPENFMHHHDLAVSYASVRLFRKAIDEGLTAVSLWRKQARRERNILWTLFVIASSYFNLGMIEEAENAALEALGIAPDHLDSHFVLACIAAARRDAGRFELSYSRVHALAGEYRRHPERLQDLLLNKINELWRLEIDRATLHLVNGMEKSAEECFSAGAAGSPCPATAYRLAAVSCRDQGYPGLAEKLLEKAAEAGLDAHTVHFERALIRKAAGDCAGYERIVLEIIARKEKLPPSLVSEAGMEAMRLGKYPEAESLLAAAAEQGYDCPGLSACAALACKGQGKIDRAIEWNQRALAMEENHLDALVNLGNLHYDLQNWDSARSCYQRAAAQDIHQHTALLRLSLLSLMHQDLEQCLQYCDRLLNELGITDDLTISRIRDLGSAYRLIGEGLLRAGEERLHREAIGFSTLLEGSARVR